MEGFGLVVFVTPISPPEARAAGAHGGTVVEQGFSPSDPIASWTPGRPPGRPLAEELGAVIQVRAGDVASVLDILGAAGLAARVIGRPRADGRVTIRCGHDIVFSDTRVALQRAWSETTCCCSRCVTTPSRLNRSTTGSWMRTTRASRPCLTFDPLDDPAGARTSRPAARPPSPSCASRA